MSYYHGRYAGRLLHFLRAYTHECDNWIFLSDGKSITAGQNGPVCCTYTWLANTDIPIFTFQGQYQELNDNNERVIKEFYTEMKVHTTDQEAII